MAHAAPSHHFVDRRGLFTALDHPGHCAVMFDRSLTAAQAEAGDQLSSGVRTLTDSRAEDDPASAALAAWSLVHGFAMLWLNGAIDTDADPIATVDRVARMLVTK